jgi:hypothetical protein
MGSVEVVAERVVSDEISYGADGVGRICTFADLLLTLERNPGATTQEVLDGWDAQVAAWANEIDPEAHLGGESQIDMPDRLEEISTELAYSAIRLFRNRRYNDDEKKALGDVVIGAINDFFPDEYFIGRYQMNDLLSEIVVTPVLVLMRFDAALWRQRVSGAEAIEQ